MGEKGPGGFPVCRGPGVVASFSRQARSPLRASIGSSLVAHDVADGEATEFDEELLEFLTADLLPEPAHPVFKQQLREYLRATLIAEGRIRPRDEDASGSDG